jgi:esterase
MKTIPTSDRAGPIQPADRYLAVNGLNIHYLDWGTSGKQPFILLHGIARVARTFDPIVTHFNSRYHVLAVDLRGHGDSDWDPQGAYLVEDYVRDVGALVQQLHLRHILLWGNSTGGRVAQVLAGKHPEQVAGVIAEDVGPERPPEVSNRRADRIAREATGWTSADELFAQLKTENPRTDERVLRAEVQYGSKLRDDGRIVLKRDPRIAEGFIPTDLWHFVRQIRAPILYVLGGRSHLVPAETQEQIKRTLAQAQIVTMPDLGHYPSEEDTDGFLTIVDRFLSSLAPENPCD